MELNALYFNHQIALMNGARGFDLAAHYAKRIGEERARLGFLKAVWHDLPSAPEIVRETAQPGRV